MKKNFKPYYKNVQLISKNHPLFLEFNSQYKSDKPKINHLDLRPKSFIISWVLERVVKEWVNLSFPCLDENIICYEQLNRKEDTYSAPLCNEIDYLFKTGNNLVLGEIKVTNLEHAHYAKAKEQLITKRNLLKQNFNISDLQIIHIDLNFENSSEPFDKFESDFSKTKFQTINEDGTMFKYLHLKAGEIFDWGLKNNFCREPYLLEAAKDEAKLLFTSRKIKQEIKDKRKLLTENNSEELVSEIQQLEKNLFLNDIKANLFQRGWVHLTEQSENSLKEILDNLGKVIFTTDVVVKPESKALVTSERGLDFHTDHHKAKYIAWHCIVQTDKGGETILIDAEKVFQRLSEQHKKELESIELFEHKIFEDDQHKIPLVNNNGRRKFYYSFWLVNKEQKENAALKEFQRIIKEAELFKFLLQPNDVLLIDNHRIFHGRTPIEGSKDRFIKRFWLQANSK